MEQRRQQDEQLQTDLGAPAAALQEQDTQTEPPPRAALREAFAQTAETCRECGGSGAHSAGARGDGSGAATGGEAAGDTHGGSGAHSGGDGARVDLDGGACRDPHGDAHGGLRDGVCAQCRARREAAAAAPPPETAPAPAPEPAPERKKVRQKAPAKLESKEAQTEGLTVQQSFEMASALLLGLGPGEARCDCQKGFACSCGCHYPLHEGEGHGARECQKHLARAEHGAPHQTAGTEVAALLDEFPELLPFYLQNRARRHGDPAAEKAELAVLGAPPQRQWPSPARRAREPVWDHDVPYINPLLCEDDAAAGEQLEVTLARFPAADTRALRCQQWTIEQSDGE